jgi:stage II sporulation protein AA (anti-sigma F factor antagonist)
MARSAKNSDLFDFEQQGDTVIIVPVIDMREFEYQRILSEAKQVFELIESRRIKNVIMDFSKTDYYGSTALSFFLKLWKRVTSRGGSMAFCNISAHERKILEVTGLHKLWPICTSRKEALDQIGEKSQNR